MKSIKPLRVVIAGGGIAGLEALLALHDLGEAQLQLTMIAPEPDFVLRPLIVAEPFAPAHRERLSLAEVTSHFRAQLRCDAVAGVNDEKKVAICASGEEVPYDVLILATGGHQLAPYPSGALTFGLTRDPLAYSGLLADVERGRQRFVAFVVPPATSWSLPLYELALMTARQARSTGQDNASFTLITPEASPLAIFGPDASAAVAELLHQAGIALEVGVYADVLGGGQVRLTPGGRRLAFHRIVTLPLIAGQQLSGVPVDACGFVPVDKFGRVLGLDDVYCAGDATDFPVKQGGLATQQADAIAEHIAARAGAVLEPKPFKPVLRGRLMTGSRDRFLRTAISGGDWQGEASEDELWWPPAKVSGRYLAPWLAMRGLGRHEAEPPAEGFDVELPLSARGMPAPTLEHDPPEPIGRV